MHGDNEFTIIKTWSAFLCFSDHIQGILYTCIYVHVHVAGYFGTCEKYNVKKLYIKGICFYLLYFNDCVKISLALYFDDFHFGDFEYTNIPLKKKPTNT